MNVSDAAYDTVHAYPGGSVTLAARLGMSDAVLRGKVNPNNDRNHLTLDEADRIIGLTGDHRILHALAAAHGYTLQRAEGEEGSCVVTALLALVSAQGAMSQAVSDSIADGKITPNEAAAIARVCAEVQATAATLASSARAASEAHA